MTLLHQIQSQDAEDPWLQAEWGESMLQQGRVHEGAMHLSAGEGRSCNLIAHWQCLGKGLYFSSPCQSISLPLQVP